MFDRKKTTEDILQDLSNEMYKKLFYRMKKEALTNSQIAKIILNDCLELKIEDSQFTEKTYPDLNRIFLHTHSKFNIPAHEMKAHPFIQEPMDFAIFLAIINPLEMGLDPLPSNLNSLTKLDLYERFLKQWYLREQDQLTRAEELVHVYHDVYQDFKATGEYLGALLHVEKELKDPIGKILKTYGSVAHEKDIIRAVNANPLRQNSDGTYVFIHPRIADYFATAAVFNQPLPNTDDSPTVGSPIARKTM